MWLSGHWKFSSTECHDSELINHVWFKKISPLPLPCSFIVTASRCVVHLKVRYAHVHQQSQTAHIPTNVTCCSGSHVLTLALTLNTGFCHWIALLSRYRTRLISHSPYQVHKINVIKGTWYMSVLFSLKLITGLRLNHIFDLCSKSKVCNFC